MVRTFPEGFQMDGFVAHQIEVDNEFEEGTVREIRWDGIRVCIRNLAVKDFKIEVQHDFPFFKTQFEIEGSSDYRPFDATNPGVYIPGGHYNLFHLPVVDGTLRYRTSYRKTLEIVFTENYVRKLIGDGFKNVLNDFGMAITNNRSYLMWDRAQPISVDLMEIVQIILDCGHGNDLERAFFKSKVNELLIVLLAKTEEKDRKKIYRELSKCDYPKIIETESYIRNNLKKNITISQLAVRAGINTTKLKDGFKVVYGKTIFKYITSLRMAEAKRLITDHGKTVAEASYCVGYKNPQHFTVAFKKVYGYLPSKLQQH